MMHRGSHPGQLLQGTHDYEVTVGDIPLRLSIQLFLNPRHHYRLFAFSPNGMLISVNFTIAEDAQHTLCFTNDLRPAKQNSIGDRFTYVEVHAGDIDEHAAGRARAKVVAKVCRIMD